MCYQLLIQVAAAEERSVLEAIYSQSGLHTHSTLLNGASALCLSERGGCSCSMVDAQHSEGEECVLAVGARDAVITALAAAKDQAASLDFVFRWADGSDEPVERIEHVQFDEIVGLLRQNAVCAEVVYRVSGSP
jgi:hypothetical protein